MHLGLQATLWHGLEAIEGQSWIGPCTQSGGKYTVYNILQRNTNVDKQKVDGIG
uniref:Uncharacterized protein n=1 Tax=Anguilla anguilla TaxID=7936 RepID=A0A0E9V6A8_ANGAN